MVAMGNWGLAHRDGTRELRVRAELLRDGGPELSERFMDELREAHLGIPLSDPDPPQASEQLQAAYEAATTGGLDQWSRDLDDQFQGILIGVPAGGVG